MKELEVEIRNSQGLHARPAGEIVKTVKKYNSSLTIKKEDFEVSGDSILEIMSLGVEKGEKLILRAEGAEEEKLIFELQKLIEIDKFFED